MVNKKSQMEIMGLAVIVILVVIGLAFMIKFMAQKKPVEYKEEYSKSELVTNIINTMLKTTATTMGSCKGMSFSELLVKCKEDPTGFKCDLIDIDGDGSDEKDVCEVAKKGIKTILDNTIGKNKLKMNYYFIVAEDTKGTTLLGNNDFKLGSDPTPTPCKGAKKSNIYPIPTTSAGDNIYIKLDICG